MINYKTILILLLASTFPVRYVEAETAINAKAVVKIVVAEGNGVRSWGSGVHLGNGIILSCAHLGGPNAQIIFPNNNAYNGTLVSADRDWDQAVYDIGQGVNEEWAPLASENPVLGEPLESGGYPGGGQQAWRLGKLVRFTSSSNSSQYDDFIVFTNAVTEGTSGGPVFNAKGEVVGVVWGSRQSENVSYAQCTSRTRRFLLPHSARLEATRQMIQGGYSYQSCQSGNCGSSCQQMTAPGSRQVISTYNSNGQPINRGQSPPQVTQQPGPDPLAAIKKDIEDLKVSRDAHKKLLDEHSVLIATNKSDLESLKSQLNQLQTVTTQIQALTETNTKAIIDLKEVTNNSNNFDPAALAAINEKISNLQKLIEDQQKEKPESVKIEYRGWMYFTSKGIPGCEEIDQKIADLRSKGAPIAVTYLTPQEAQVSGVPRIFVMHENQQVKGISNCKQYLASLVPY
jgi:serine protease Do